MLGKHIRTLRTAIVIEIALSAFVLLFLLADLLEPSSRIDVSIGSPIVMVIMVVQLLVGGVALIRSRRLNK